MTHNAGRVHYTLFLLRLSLILRPVLVMSGYGLGRRQGTGGDFAAILLISTSPAGGFRVDEKGPGPIIPTSTDLSQLTQRHYHARAQPHTRPLRSRWAEPPGSLERYVSKPTRADSTQLSD